VLNNVKSLIHRAGTRSPRAEFETRVSLDKKESIERGHASSYVESASLTPPQQENNSNGLQGKRD
jgi:hypothetical protein